MTMNIGDVYYWETGVPHFMKDIKYRYFDVLSVTLTHVYVRNKFTRNTQNKDIKTFLNDYKLIHREE